MIYSRNLENLSNIDGIGEAQVKSVGVFLSYKTNLTVIEKLKKIMKIFNTIPNKKNGILKNKTFMFTGKLKEISRAEAKSLVEQNSGEIISNVNKKLNYFFLTVDETVKFFLPLARLLLRSFRPPFVFILDLKPCFFSLLPFFG